MHAFGMGMLADLFCARCLLRSLVNSEELWFSLKGGMICLEFSGALRGI